MMHHKDTMILRAAGRVRRMHTTGRTVPQSNAEHSWGVAMLLLTVWPDCPTHLVRAALVHDLPELRTGDIPAFVKWNNPLLETELKKLERQFHQRFLTQPYELEEEERAVLKWCDGVELMLYCMEELEQGNRHVLEMFHRILHAIMQRGIPARCIKAWDYYLQRADKWIRQRPEELIYMDEDV